KTSRPAGDRGEHFPSLPFGCGGAALGARILAAFNKKPMFCNICKNRTWRSSAKPQCFAVFILAAFKTAQYPCGFAHSCRTQKHPFLPLIHPQTSHFTSKPQHFAIFILASFKTAQYPCMFAPSQIFKKHRFCSRPYHNLAAFKKIPMPCCFLQNLSWHPSAIPPCFATC
ncbi:MAG: hypothetical protein ACP5O7_10040, partial [Phycisphaerae bacterium]